MGSFSCRGCTFDPAGLEHLGKLSNLSILYLNDTNFSDEGLRHIARLKELGDLGLSGTQVTDAGMVHLAGLTTLRWLRLGSSKLTGVGMTRLVDAEALTRVSLGYSALNVGGGAAMIQLESVGSFDVRGNELSYEQLAKLEGRDGLYALNLAATGIDAGEIEKLRGILGESCKVTVQELGDKGPPPR